MNPKKIIGIIIFCLATSHAILAQTWQECYDSTQYYFQKKNYSIAVSWADKFMIFTNLFITDQSTLPSYYQVLNYAYQSYLALHQKENGIAHFTNWYKKIDAIPATYQNGFAYNKSVILANLSFYIGEFYYKIGKYSLAQVNYAKTLAVYSKQLGEETPEYEECLQKLGRLMQELGDYETAERMLIKNASLTEDLYGKKHIQHAEALNQVGDIFSAKSDTSTAIYFYKQAKEIYESIENGLQSVSYAHNLVSQGELYYRMGFYTAAEALYRQAQYIYEKNAYLKQAEYADLLNKFSQIYLRLNNLSDAYRLIEQAMQIHLQVFSPQHPAYAKDLWVLGSIYLKVKDTQRAEIHLNKALNIYQKSGLHKQIDYFLAMSQMAECHKIAKQFDKAEALFLSAIDSFSLYIGEKNIESASIEAKLANLYYQTGKYAQAEEMHEACLETRYELLDESHPDLIESINDVSLLYWADKKISKAEKFFQQSIQNYTKQFNRYFSFLSEIEKEFYYSRIRNFFEKFNNFALERSKQKPVILGQIYDNHLSNKGLLFYTTQKIRNQVFESKDENLLHKYKSWVQLKEQLAKVYKLNYEEILAQGIPLDSLEEIANFIEKDLSLRIAIGNTKAGREEENITWKTIQRNLKADEAAIEMLRFQEFKPDSGGYFTEKVYYAALIITSKTTKNPTLVLLENGKEMETRQIRFYRNSIKFRIKDTQSYKNFWQAIDTARVLQGIKKIYFSPDGVYNQLNINTLFDEENQKFILDKTEIHTLTNTRDLIELKKKNLTSNINSESKAVLLGYPNYQSKQGKPNSAYKISESNPNATLTRGFQTRDGIAQLRGGRIEELPGTKEEVLAIQKIFNQYQIKNEIELEDSASESRLKNTQRPLYLHIATHGFFNADMNTVGKETSDSSLFVRERNMPLMNSGLLLVGAANAYTDETILAEINALRNGTTYEDGMLTAYEAMNLDLRETELVVLSACETGLGEVRNGEGVYGLQRAFQTAGAKTIVMSLWKVSDEATKQLMINLYDELCKTKNKRQAFVTAQLKLRKQFSDAYFWGAFLMIGE